MDTTIISAMAGVLGSFVGASTTIMTAWITQKTKQKRELIRAEIDKREVLYGEFIGECSKLVIDAYGHALESPEKLLPAYALLNRIRLSASEAVLTEADRIVRWITEQYFSPNLLPEDMCAVVRSQEIDPLKPFGEACRAELKSIRAHVWHRTRKFRRV
jgi:hypothetical protein